MTPAEIYKTARPDRFARTIRTDSPEGCRIALLGLPDDTGVALNGGRVGAKDGPRAFREALAGYGTTTYIAYGGKIVDLSKAGVFDAGDVEPIAGGTVVAMERTHERVTARVCELLEANLLPVCIGGGHDLTWPAARAVAQKFPDLAGIYFDAHLDVREEPGSGMAFRKILAETNCQSLTACFLDPVANNREHVDWFLANRGTIHDVGLLKRPSIPFFCSFDLDCMSAAFAPGVSAANPAGIEAPVFARHQIYDLGRALQVRYFDIMELNPKYDIDGRTARLAAHLFLSFLAGYSSRTTR